MVENFLKYEYHKIVSSKKMKSWIQFLNLRAEHLTFIKQVTPW